MSDATRVAVLIDCDNISHRLAEQILVEASSYGRVSIKRGYGDWSSELLKGWRDGLSRHAIQPIQQPAYTRGKNSTDSALIIDAMDLLYADNVDVFCLVSSDSDFTRLATRLRESARRVHGIGARNTPESFVNACDRFTFTEVLTGQPLTSVVEGRTSVTAPIPQDVSATRGTGGEADPSEDNGDVPPLPEIRELLIPAIQARATEDGWAMLSMVGWQIVTNNPSFDSRNYGFAKLGMLVRKLPFIEVKDEPAPNGFPQRWVRVAPGK